MRIAFHVPRAEWLEPGVFPGDRVFVAHLLASLSQRGHEVRIPSRLNVRDVGRGRIAASLLEAEAISIQQEMERFLPDVWFVYMPSVNYPDLFGWRQRPKRYVIFAADTSRVERLREPLRELFSFAHARSLERADAALRSRLGQAARQTVRREHTWDRVAERILEMATRETAHRRDLVDTEDGPCGACDQRL